MTYRGYPFGQKKVSTNIQKYKIFQERFRKYEKVENESPIIVTIYSGWRSYI